MSRAVSASQEFMMAIQVVTCGKLFKKFEVLRQCYIQGAAR
jgi:hypothetical protein